MGNGRGGGECGGGDESDRGDAEAGPVAEAAAWLGRQLAGGEWVKSAEMEETLDQAGISYATYRRAKKQLGIEHSKEHGSGEWLLRLADGDAQRWPGEGEERVEHVEHVEHDPIERVELLERVEHVERVELLEHVDPVERVVLVEQVERVEHVERVEQVSTSAHLRSLNRELVGACAIQVDEVEEDAFAEFDCDSRDGGRAAVIGVG